MIQVAVAVHRIAKTDLSALIIGESGTGKEVVATALHAHSRRADMPLVRFNAAAIPSVIETENNRSRLRLERLSRHAIFQMKDEVIGVTRLSLKHQCGRDLCVPTLVLVVAAQRPLPH